MAADGRLPVLVGAGIADQHVDDPSPGAAIGGVDAVELMVQAVRAAAEDADAPDILRSVKRIAVPQGTWSYPDPARLIAERIGAPDARTVFVQVGIPQQRLINEALRAVLDGDLEVALVVGGEAKRRDTLAQRAGIPAPSTEQVDARPDEQQQPVHEIVAKAEIDARVVVPVQQYALIESALRRAEGRTLDQHRDDIAEMWAACSTVAAANPHAAFPEARTPAFLREPSPRNRPLAFPYNKWHATQWNVDQAAALLICSVDAARAHGIDPDRFVHPRVGLESSSSTSLSTRGELHRWPAMRVLGDAASAHLGAPLRDLAHVDLYSCFPVAVRVQQRELGLSLDAVPTITGGMAFAGGPFNNYVLQSTAAMVEALRSASGELGLVTTVSGLLTKPGLAVWSTEQGDGAPLVADLAGEADAATAAVESVAGYRGAATIATYTVTYDGEDPTSVIAIGDTDDGRRCVAVADDAALAARGTVEELIGLPMQVDGTAFRPA